MNDQHKSDLMMSTEFDCSDDDSDDNGKTLLSPGSSDDSIHVPVGYLFNSF